MPLDIFSVDGAGLQVENYIYMYHLQEFIVLPSFVDSVQENFRISWQQTTPLGRSAPIYSFQSSGPRTVQLTFNLHRDLMYQINKDVSDAKVAIGDDYVDTLIKDLQACVLPDYDGTAKAVNPPVVAVRIGNDIFIKGVITSNLGVTWNYPILSNGKYSNMSINLEISEIDPYDARTVRNVGSYRNLNLNSTLDYGNIAYSTGMMSPYPGATYENGTWSVKGATNMLPVTGTGKDVYIRRDENGNPIIAKSSNTISTVNQSDLTYIELVESNEKYEWPPTGSSASTTPTTTSTAKQANEEQGILDEYGGIVGGNKAGKNLNNNMTNKNVTDTGTRSNYGSNSTGAASAVGKTRMLPVHPQRTSTNIIMGYNTAVYSNSHSTAPASVVDDYNAVMNGEMSAAEYIENINDNNIYNPYAVNHPGVKDTPHASGAGNGSGGAGRKSKAERNQDAGIKALQMAEDAEQYGLSRQSASGENINQVQ